MRFLALLAIAAACSKSADPKQEDKPQATPGSAATLASATDAAGFCTRAYFKMMDCFKDDEFWQVFATVYFANTNLTSDETERQHWIGVMKEDLLKLYNEHGFEENCRVSVENNKVPTEASIKKVSDAAQKSCAAFGSAFGYMVFNEGAFHQPK
jgi:hypothetical protein